jgi:dihydrofolate synthase/folylpolyglutamate synthase
LKEFTERIRINGEEIHKEDVVAFVEKIRSHIDEIKPSFFEITVAMAFWYFAKSKVDFAVIEVGLGGRLDSTNIITPEVSLITNISYDHTDMLGDTLQEIAGEKAGIIKEGVPVVIGEKQSDSAPIFMNKANAYRAPIFFASDTYEIREKTVVMHAPYREFDFTNDKWPEYLVKNVPGVLSVSKIIAESYAGVNEDTIESGLRNFKSSTSFKGRWQILEKIPLTICDTAHNEAGIKVIVKEISHLKYDSLHMVIGMVADKNIRPMLDLLPRQAHYYFCKPDIPRGKDAYELYIEALEVGLQGSVIEDVNEAVNTAITQAGANDLVYIGGSTFVVAELNGI